MYLSAYNILGKCIEMLVVIFLLVMASELALAGSVRTVEVVNAACSPAVECVTLAECLGNIATCFASDTKINFVEKFYEVPESSSSNFFIVRNARDLTLSGNGSTIACTTRPVGFSFINVSNLQIHGLHLDGCGEVMPDILLSQLHLARSENAFFMSSGTRVALLLGNVNHLALHNIRVHNSCGYGLLIADSIWIEVRSSNFTHNNRRALKCYHENVAAIDMSCCHGLLSHDATEGNCNGGNIAVINTRRASYATSTQTEISNTRITHGVNLDIQHGFNENYTYTAGGLSLYYSDHLHESVLISHCTIASNIGHSSGNAVMYIHDNSGSDFTVTITQTDFLGGNTGFERFEKTAKSGGLTIEYGYVDEHHWVPGAGHHDVKRVIIQHSTFRGNMAFTAGAILFQSHIVRDKSMQAEIRINNCTISDNFGYDTIFTVRGNLGNRFYNLELEMVGVRLLNNRILHEVSLADPLLAYHHFPHISTLHTEEIGTVTCVGITIQENELRGVSMRLNTDFRFRKGNVISGNRGTEGGALLIDRTPIRLQFPGAMLYIVNNTATLSGGAIYVVPSPPRLISVSPFCFFTFRLGLFAGLRGSVLLRNNSAGVSGNSVYGGSIETCMLYETDYSLTGVSAFETIFDIPWNTSLTEVTSNVEELCFCINKRPQCALGMWPISTYPGMRVRIPTVAVGQMNGTNPAIVLSRIVGSSTAHITDQEMRQQVGVECHDLNYTIHSLESIQFEIKLGIVTNGKVFETDQTILVNMTECPKGFELVEHSRKCSCIPLLEEHEVSCFLEAQNFERKAGVWVGYNAEAGEFLAHGSCPFQKCRPKKSTFALNSTDSHCERGFSGIICGGCASNLSSTFGRIGCRKCSGAFSAVVVVIFLLAGPLLIAAMLYGDLTVNDGTFNGIIFYANVVHIYRGSLFGLGHISVVSVLIAWLNLDLGIDLCFYPGMTFYAQVWFQYSFPAYVLVLARILSYLNWYTTLGGKIIGNNIRNVEGTLVLLSYTKLLRLVAETLSFTTVSSSLSIHRKVWLYDGNILYMEAKHAALAAASLVTLACFLLPFTFLMLFEYPLLKFRAQRILVKSGLYTLIHVFQKPYNRVARWWTGVMLLVRVLLVVLYQVNTVGNQEVSMIVIVTLGLCVLGAMWNLGSLYRNTYVTVVETFYITNLVLLAGWSQYTSSRHSQLILSYILVTGALLGFLATIVYHVVAKVVGEVKERRKKSDEGLVDNQRVILQHLLKDYDGQAVSPISQTCVRVSGDQQPLSKILANNSNIDS